MTVCACAGAGGLRYNNASMYDQAEWAVVFLTFWTMRDGDGVGVGSKDAKLYQWIRDNNALGEVCISTAATEFGMALGAGSNPEDYGRRAGLQAALVLGACLWNFTLDVGHVELTRGCGCHRLSRRSQRVRAAHPDAGWEPARNHQPPPRPRTSGCGRAAEPGPVGGVSVSAGGRGSGRHFAVVASYAL